jgi:hypothetical protein
MNLLGSRQAAAQLFDQLHPAHETAQALGGGEGERLREQVEVVTIGVAPGTCERIEEVFHGRLASLAASLARVPAAVYCGAW